MMTWHGASQSAPAHRKCICLDPLRSCHTQPFPSRPPTQTNLQASWELELGHLRCDNCLRSAEHPVALCSPVAQSLWGPPQLIGAELSAMHAAAAAASLAPSSGAGSASTAGPGSDGALAPGTSHHAVVPSSCGADGRQSVELSAAAGAHGTGGSWPTSPTPHAQQQGRRSLSLTWRGTQQGSAAAGGSGSPTAHHGHSQAGAPPPTRQSHSGSGQGAGSSSAPQQVLSLSGHTAQAHSHPGGGRGPPPALSFQCAIWRDRPGGVLCVQHVGVAMAPLAVHLEEVHVRSLVSWAAANTHRLRHRPPTRTGPTFPAVVGAPGAPLALPATPAAHTDASRGGVPFAAGAEGFGAGPSAGLQLQAAAASAMAGSCPAVPPALDLGRGARALGPLASPTAAWDGGSAAVGPGAGAAGSGMGASAFGKRPAHEPDVRALAGSLPQEVLQRPKLYIDSLAISRIRMALSFTPAPWRLPALASLASPGSGASGAGSLPSTGAAGGSSGDGDGSGSGGSGGLRPPRRSIGGRLSFSFSRPAPGRAHGAGLGGEAGPSAGDGAAGVAGTSEGAAGAGSGAQGAGDGAPGSSALALTGAAGSKAGGAGAGGSTLVRLALSLAHLEGAWVTLKPLALRHPLLDQDGLGQVRVVDLRTGAGQD